jgi:predicted negative regulator of RcsB-dependent stress response
MLQAEFFGITRRYAEAEQMLRAIIAKDPKNTDLQVRLANLLVNQNKVDEALKALEPNADDSRVARARVEILLTANRLTRRRRPWRRSSSARRATWRSSSSPPACSLRGTSSTSASTSSTARWRSTPNNATTHYFVGLMKMNQPKPDTAEAIKEFTKGKDSPTMGVDSSFALAEAMRRRSDVDGAIRELEGALQRQPTNKRVRLALIDAYLGLRPRARSTPSRAITRASAFRAWPTTSDLLQREVTILAQTDSEEGRRAGEQGAGSAPDDMVVVRKSLDLLLKARRYNDVNDRRRRC